MRNFKRILPILALALLAIPFLTPSTASAARLANSNQVKAYPCTMNYVTEMVNCGYRLVTKKNMFCYRFNDLQEAVYTHFAARKKHPKMKVSMWLNEYTLVDVYSVCVSAR